MNGHASMLPLTTPLLAEQASRYICLQQALRQVEAGEPASPELLQQATRLVDWLDPRVQEALQVLQTQPWWHGPSVADDPQAVIDGIERTASDLTTPSVEQTMAIANLDCLLSLRMYFAAIKHEDAPAEGDAGDHLRMIAEHLQVAEIPVPQLLWPKGAIRPSVADGRIVPTTDIALPEAMREAAGTATHLLLAPLQGVSLPQQPMGEVACDLTSNDPHHLHRVGQVCALVDTIQLYGMQQQAHDDERTAVAHVFAALVQQQQQLMMTLEGMGFRIDTAAATPVPADCPSIAAFSLGAHEVFLRELRLVQQAKETGLVRHGMAAYDRLKGEVEKLLQADPQIPEVPGGWVPSRKEARRIASMQAHVFAFAKRGEETVPVVFRMSVDGARQEQARSLH